jgi:hypothetical protein
MTIQRAKEIFKGKIDHLSDQEINEMINHTGIMLDAIFSVSRKQLTTNRQKVDTN